MPFLTFSTAAHLWPVGLPKIVPGIFFIIVVMFFPFLRIGVKLCQTKKLASFWVAFYLILFFASGQDRPRMGTATAFDMEVLTYTKL